MLAFLLEASSSQFVAYLGNALGLLRPSLANLLKQQGTAAGTSGKDVEAGDPDDDFVLSMPPFVPAATAECLSRAKRSLKFLKSARPEHPLCSARKDWARLCCGWVWCTEDIERLADGVDRHLEEVEDLLCAWRRPPPDHRDALGTIPLSPTSDDVVAPLILFDVEAPSQKFAGHVYAPELAGFHLFDLELSEPATLVSDSTRPYDDFLSKFPNDLPLITPTLALLTQATLLYPLASHARLLSSSLLDLFFTDLRLLDHLRVLHSFMFLGATGFAARLREAFFSASDHEGAGSREAKQAARHKRVAPGMRLNLNERDKSLWPPSSSELSFLLRTVVEDSLVDTGAWGREQDKGGAEVWKEAVWRIGFVLETPEELGNESAKWRDPRGKTSRFCRASSWQN